MVDKPKHFPYDSPLRWEIPSQTDSHAGYIVDLGMQECQCRRHICDVKPLLKKGLRPNKFCVHMNMARERFTAWSIWDHHQRDPNREHDDNLNEPNHTD